jgi:ornithine carbamoyltransferase
MEMKDLISIKHLTKDYIYHLFEQADLMKSRYQRGEAYKPLEGKTIIASFPATSIRTRVTFETGIYQLGAQPLNLHMKFEDSELIEDKVGHLNCWMDGLVIRHSSQELVQRISDLAEFPVINAMTKESHPCEILSDLHAIKELRPDLESLKFVFIGEGANISNTWFEAAAKLSLNITQVCPEGYEISQELYDYAKSNSKGAVQITKDLEKGLKGADIILTDGWPSEPSELAKFMPYQLSLEKLKQTNKGCLVNPCPPFNRAHAVPDEVMNSEYFIGYKMKQSLLHMQKAILEEFMTS